MIDERLKTIIESNNHRRQIDKAAEELAELQQILMKWKYQEATKGNVLDELADCFIMLNQLQLIFNISEEELLERIDFKIERQLKRIQEDKEAQEEWFKVFKSEILKESEE
jgi:hypothetical protein